MADFAFCRRARRGVTAILTLLAALVVGLVVAPPAAQAAPAFVQVRAAQITAGTTANAAFASANRAGSLLVAFVSWSNAGAATITDTRGNTWTAANTRTAWGAGNAWSAQVFYAANAVAGANTVTVRFGTAIAGFGEVYVHEYTGMALTNPVDVAVSAIGTGAAMTTGSVTTTNAQNLLFAGAASDATVNQTGTNYTIRSTSFGNRTQDRSVTATGAYAATGRQNGNRWVEQLVAFKALPTVDTTPPTAPTGLAAAAVSGTQVNLAWTAATDNVGVTGYRIQRNGTQIGTTTGALTFSDTTGTPATTYSYTVTAVDAAGNVSPASTAAVATTRDTVAPAAPTGLAATPTSATRVDLAWTAATDNVGVTGYRIQRGGTQIGTTTGALAFSDTTGTPATTYSYTVTAVDAAGNVSPASATAPATTPADTTPPAAPTGLTATPTSATRVDLAWTAATDDVAVTGYRVLRDGVPIGTTTGAAANTFADTTTTANTTYAYTVLAVDAAGNASAPSAPAPATTPVLDADPPSQPTDLVATVVSGTRIDLSWTASTDDVGVDRYLVFRNGVQVATPTTATFSDTALAPATTYSYSVTAVDTSGNLSVPSATVSASTTDTVPPSAPAGLTATTVSSAQIDLAWTASTDNVAVVQYRVSRNGAQVATTAGTVTTLSDTGLTPSTAYAYTVVAVDAAGNTSAASAPASATTSGVIDLNPPTVTLTSPVGNATVADIVTVNATATDNVGVVAVQFFVDGAAAGSEDTSAPYAFNWDSRQYTNGAHTLTARARDAAGNATTSGGVTVNVANVSTFQNEILMTGFDLPTAVKFLPDGRMLVAELTGAIRVLSAPFTSASPTPFLQLTNVGNVGYAGLQQGIFDVALDPDFANNRFFYVFYTMRSPNKDRLSRFTANATLTGTDLATEVVLYQDPDVANTEHHGGAIMFGNDGKLYFTVGEHFDAGNAQLLTNPRGKLHRINLDGTVPTDNPFYDGTGPNWDSIWSYGLRNPYRGYYDTPTGRFYIGDVGGNDPATAQEEVDGGIRGANYGWPNSEGTCTGQCTSPTYSYPHNGRDASITGGFVYHGTAFPASYQGSYFFADYAQNWIKRLTFDATGKVDGVFNFEPIDGTSDGPYGDVVYLTEGPDGAVYYLDLGYSDTSGTFGVSRLRRIRYVSTNVPPTALLSATPTNGQAPLTVTFSSAGSVDPEGLPITYSWAFGDGTTSTEPNPTHTYSVSGPYDVRLTVSDGANSTISAPLRISVGTLPTPQILTPGTGTSFVAGDTISFSGDGTDAVDGTIPASGFTWVVDFLHDGHVHPGSAVSGSRTGSFVVPTSGHDYSGNTRYRITLTVVNSAGLSASTSVIVTPTKVNLSFSSAPAGLTLYLDGIAHVTPFVYDTIPGFNHLLEARDQSAGTSAYTFSSWSDGGAQSHTIVVPTVDRSFTATYATSTIVLPPAFVQVAAATPQTDQSSVPVVYASAQTAGNANVIAIGWNAATGSVASVTDTAGNTYVQAAPLAAANGLSQTIWYARNIKAAAAGANTVTVTFAAAVPFADVRITEYANLDKANPVDVVASAAGTTTTATVGPVTTTVAQDLLFVGGMTTGAFSSAGAGFTGRIITTPDLDIVEDRIATTVGSYTATANLSGASAWILQMVAFKPETGPDTTKPSAPTGLTATAAGSTQVNLTWTAATDNVGVTGYRILRDGTQVGTATGTTYSDTGLTASTAYTYTVVAVDAAGNASDPSAAATATTTTPDTTAPAAPTGLAATAVSTTQVNLTWTAATDDVAVTGYRILRDGTQVGTATGTTYSDTGLTASTAYTYTVVAVDAAGNASLPGGPATATTQAPDTTAPAAPTALTATAAGSSQVNLAWTAATDDVGVTGYRIQRNGTQVGTATGTTYSDTGLTAGTTYTYTVIAVDAAGNASPASAPATATTAIVVTPPSFVQVAAATPQTNQSVVTVRYAGAQTAGNTNIVAIGWNAATGSVLSVVDSAGNAYVPAVATVAANALSQTIWFAPNIKASAANTNTVTVTFSTALPFVDLRATEYRGLLATGTVDVAASGSGTAATATAGPVVTTGANELLFAAGMTQGGFTGAGAGWTSRIITNPDLDIALDRVAATAGSYSATANVSGAWIMQVVAFRSA